MIVLRRSRTLERSHELGIGFVPLTMKGIATTRKGKHNGLRGLPDWLHGKDRSVGFSIQLVEQH